MRSELLGDVARSWSVPGPRPVEATGWIASLPPPQAYVAGIELFQQGSTPRDAYLVVKGLVKLVRLNANGRELILALRHAGSFVGAAAAITGTVHPMSAVIVTRCELRRVPADFLVRLITSGELTQSMVRMLSHEVLDQTERLVQLACLSSRQRLERVLWQLASCEGEHHHPRANGKAARLRLPLKQCELAGLVAVTPEHLSRLLRQLQDEHVIRFHKGWLNLYDPARLRGMEE